MKNRNVTLILVLILAGLVGFLMTRPLFLPNLANMAKAQVYNDIYDKIKKDVDKENTNFTDRQKLDITSKEYKEYIKENQFTIKQDIVKKAQEKRAFYQNEHNHTYIIGIDSYYWLRLIDNLINKGHIGESVRDGKNYDELVDTSIEDSLAKSSHLILGSLVYRIFNLMHLKIDYEITLPFIPVLFCILLAILTFFVTKLLSKSNMAAFFAVIVVNLSPLLLERIMGEWLDTDIYNVFFPVLIFGAFLYVFMSDSKRKSILGIVIFAISCSLYASIWQGWWYIFDLLILSGLIFLINDYYSEGKDFKLFKKKMLWLGLLFILGILTVGLLNGKDSLFSFIKEPAKLVFVLKTVPKDNWPNVFLTVAELMKVSSYGLAKQLGGVAIFFVAILGSIYLILSKKVMRDKKIGIGFFCLFIWLSALYYASLNAIRFALLLVPPLGIMFGLVFDMLIKMVFKFSLKYSKKIRYAALIIITVIVYLFLSSYISRAYNTASSRIPLVNDAWYKSLVYIRDNSRPDAIIDSWWDYGHWYTFIGKRKVLFDGKTQNSPVAFWMAKVLTTDNEEEAVGILRMLNLSRNKAFDLLESSNISHVKAVKILEDVAKLKELDARKYLESYLDKAKIDKLIPLLYASKLPEVYFIASYDLIMKMGAISHIGNWDFKNGDIWIHSKEDSPFKFVDYVIKEYGYSKEEAFNLLDKMRAMNEKEALGWISHINVMMVETLSDKFKKENNLLLFDNDLIVDTSNYNAYILRGKGQDIGVPYSISYMVNGTIKENVLKDSNVDFAVMLFNEIKDDKPLSKSIFLNKELNKSLFTRMYFFKGEGLKYFKKVHEEKTEEGNRIFVYKIEWPK